MSSQGIPLSAPSGRARALPGLTWLGWVSGRPPQLLLGSVLLLAIVLVTFVGPLVYRASPYTINPLLQLAPPSAQALMGTDQIGRDELARIIAGGQDSLIVGFAASALAVLVGLLYGLSAGLGPKLGDQVLMRVLDALLSVPTLVILIFLASFFRMSDAVLILLLGLTSWPRPARVIRNETFATRGKDFVTASRQFGARPLFVARTHILRMILPILVVNFVFLVADNILALSFLSFLGLGVPPPIPTWGNLLTDGLQNIFSNSWWLIYPPGLMIFFSVIAVKAIGEGIVTAMERS